MKKECRICVNDSSVRNIRFNKEGVCNFCENYLNEKEKLKDYDKLETLFTERIEKIKGKHRYDAAVGISGGKDSVFVLYELKEKYDLNIKAFTMNNGFLSDEARHNIDKIVKEFDVEHEYIDFDKELLQRFYRYSVKKWLVPCIACFNDKSGIKNRCRNDSPRQKSRANVQSIQRRCVLFIDRSRIKKSR